jgi:membrane fusion protein (multidrug efflux system)
MNKAVVAVLVVLVILVAAGAGYWFGSVRVPVGSRSAPGQAPGPGAIANAAVGASKGQAAVPVEITRVGTASLLQTITAVGTLRSDESVTLRPEVAGRITAILFEEGQRVSKGATLVRLDPAITAAELQQARANLTLAKTKYDRAVDLAGRTFISGQAKDEAKHSFDIAEAAVALAEAKLAKMELKAPFAGIIGLRVVSIGDYVKEGADLVNLEAIDPLKVDFRVPETFLTQVQVGQPIKVALDALPGESYDGKVIALNPLVDAAGRSIVIRAQVRNQNTALRPGMFARVTLITRTEKDALVLPEEAFVPQGTEQYVFRVVDGKAARVKVETGQRRDGKVEIVSGVGGGDVVVTAGQSRLRDGAQVRITDTQTGKTAPDASKPSPSASSRSTEGREKAK